MSGGRLFDSDCGFSLLRLGSLYRRGNVLVEKVILLRDRLRSHHGLRYGLFFNGLLDGVYGGNVRKLLADEKLLRSAFLFHIREMIPRRELPDEAEISGEEPLED